MLQNDNLESILKAQKGNQQEMTKLIEENNRTYMEHCKEILWKRN